MHKRFFATILLFATFFLNTASFLRAGDDIVSSKTESSASAQAPEQADEQFNIPVAEVSDAVAVSSATAEAEAENKPTDMDIFRAHYKDNPALAAKAMLGTMDDLLPEEVDKFQDYYCNEIASMIVSLDTKNIAGELSKEDYTAITIRMGEYGLYTLQTDAYGILPGARSLSMGTMSIDIIPMKQGIKPRPWPVSNAKPVIAPKVGSAMYKAIHGTLIPPKNGFSARLQLPNSKQTIEINPVMALVTAHKAMRDGDKKLFSENVQKAEQYFAPKPRVHIAAASLYYDVGDFHNSESAATRAIGLSKNDPDAYKARAMARNALKNRKGAIEDVNKAVEINPQDESARLLSLLIDSQKPVKSFKTVSSLQSMRRQLGIRDDSRYAMRSDPVKIELSTSAKSIPTSADANVATDYAKSKGYAKTAQAKNRLGDYDSAVSYASLALEKDPNNLDAYIERASAYNSLGRYEDVIRDTTYVIGKDESNMQAFNLRSWALNRKNNPVEAANDAERAIGINPNFADAWFNHGLASEKQGNYKRMLEDFKQAASLNETYNRKYQDALAQYGGRVPGFSASMQNQISDLGGEVQEPVRNPMSRFLMILMFTLVGGALIAIGLVHVFTGPPNQTAKHVKKRQGSTVDGSILSPSVFYEGVATGKYKIEKKVGEGAMGKVYLAVDKSLGRKVAIKKMNDEIKVNEREKHRFLEEARTVALLHHPNIVEIYTIFEESGDVFLVFEYLEGSTLDRELDKSVRMSFARMRGIFDEVAKALEYAHSKGVVHRDLKLSNIMLTSEGYVKVMDFGLAGRAIEAKVNSGNREIVGSPAYMAPEQANGQASIRSDIYSLGVCVYEALTGVLPFQGPDFYNQKMRNFYEPVTQSVPGLPKAVDTILEKCLDVDPQRRFANAEEFRAALDAIHI